MSRLASIALSLVLLLGGLAVAATPAAADDCGGLAGTAVAGECLVTTEITAAGTYNLPGSLRVLGTGRIVVPPLPAGNALTLNVAGDVQIDVPTTVNGGQINGGSDVYGPNPTGIGATISIVAGGHVSLLGDGTFGALVGATGDPYNCAGAGQGGNVSIVSQAGEVVLEPGSEVTVSSQCPAGSIVITAQDGGVYVGGVVEAAAGTAIGGTFTRQRGGPISINAAASLAIAATGRVSSRGRGPGADLVHLEAGLDAEILGLVESSAGIVPDGLPNRCTGAFRPGKPALATACIEVWVGGDLVIDSLPPANGFLHARTGQSATISGVCCAWIDLFAMGDISVRGRAITQGAPYSIDASQFTPNAKAGQITIKAVKGRIQSSGRAIIANASTYPGGLGGTIVIEAGGPNPADPTKWPDVLSNIDLYDSSVRAIGANLAPGGGGQIRVKSFNGQITGGSNQPTSIMFGELNASGFSATVDLYVQNCSENGYTGAIIPFTPPQPAACGGSPSLPAFAQLPTYLARPTLHVSGAGTFVYTGTPRTATATVTGLDGEPLGDATVTYSSGTPPVDPGTYTVTATWPGNAVYRAVTATAQIVIIPSNLPAPTVAVTGGSVTYTGQPHAATATVIADGQPLTPVTITYDGSTQPPVDAGTYEVVATFAGNFEYAPASATTTLTITPATPVVTVQGGVFTYDGNAHGAIGTAVGVQQEPLGPLAFAYLGQSSGSTTVPQFIVETVDVVWTLAASRNYAAATGQTTIVITPATPVMTLAGTGSFPANGQPRTVTASVIGVNAEVLGLGGTTGTVTILYNGAAAAPSTPGTYAILATYSGNAQYTSRQASGTLTITPAIQEPPACAAAAPTTPLLWPPNHKFVDVGIQGVTGTGVTITITAISQDEPVNERGDGHTGPDATGVGTASASLRAERSGRGDGRIYEIGFRATDSVGMSCTGTVQVGVPNDQNRPAVDSGVRFDSTGQ